MRAKISKNSMTNYSIQIRLPSDLANRILVWGDDNIGDDLLYTNSEDPAFGREDDPHVTILYRMDNDQKTISDLLDGQKTFDIKLGKTSLFTTNDLFDVLKIDVNGDGVFRLNSILTEGLRPPGQYSRYIPHVTIGFLKKNTGNEFCDLDVFDGEDFVAGELWLACRNGNKTKINWRHE